MAPDMNQIDSQENYKSGPQDFFFLVPYKRYQFLERDRPEERRNQLESLPFDAGSETSPARVLTRLPNYCSNARASHQPSANWEARILSSSEGKSKAARGCTLWKKTSSHTHLPISPGSGPCGTPGVRGLRACSECILQGELSFTFSQEEGENSPSINNINHGFTKACRHLANPKINTLQRFIHQVGDSSWAEGSGRHCF